MGIQTQHTWPAASPTQSYFPSPSSAPSAPQRFPNSKNWSRRPRSCMRLIQTRMVWLNQPSLSLLVKLKKSSTNWTSMGTEYWMLMSEPQRWWMSSSSGGAEAAGGGDVDRLQLVSDDARSRGVSDWA